MSQILQNAVLSIQVGMEDFAAGGRGRVLAALRNIHAGVLLMFKARLAALSPPGSGEVLIKAKIRPARQDDGSLQFVGSGKRTVDVQQIEERCGDLGITVDWKRFKKITDHRNDVEHYYPKVGDAALREVIADACAIIRDFVVKELREDPRTMLGSSTWQEMLNVASVLETERIECVTALRAVGWSSPTFVSALEAHHCAVCGSPLLLPVAGWTDLDDVTLACRSCGEEMTFDEYAEDALTEHLAADKYIAVKDGGDSPLEGCPGCLKEGFILEEDACGLCGYTRAHEECIRCAGPVALDEQDLGGLCGYCEHVTNKDD